MIDSASSTPRPARGLARLYAYLRGIGTVAGGLAFMVAISFDRAASGSSEPLINGWEGCVALGVIALMFGLILGHAWAVDPSSEADFDSLEE